MAIHGQHQPAIRDAWKRHPYRPAILVALTATYITLAAFAVVETTVLYPALRPFKLVDNSVGYQRLSAGDLAGARDFFEQALEETRRRAQAAPENHLSMLALARSYSELGFVESQQADLGASRACYEHAVDVLKHWNKSSPGDTFAKGWLAFTYWELGVVCQQSDDLAATRNCFEQQVELRRQIAAANPGDMQDQTNLATACNWLGDVCLKLGELDTARESFEEGLTIAEREAQAYPENLRVQADEAIFSAWLGSIGTRVGDLATARRYYERGLAICRRLAGAEPQNSSAQANLVDAQTQAGIVALRSFDIAAADELFTQALEMRRRPAEADVNNPELQYYLAVALVNLAAADCRSHFDFAAAERRLWEADTLLERLTGDGELASSVQNAQCIVHGRLRDCDLGPIAVGDWEAILAQPADRIYELVALRCRLFANNGRFEIASAAANHLSKLEPATPADLYCAAAAYAQVSAAALYGKVDDESRRESDRRRFADAALAALTAAVHSGFRDAQRIEADTNFWPIASSREFNAIVAQARESTDEPAPQ